MTTQQQKPHRFEFPEQGVRIVSGVVRSVRPEIGAQTAEALTSVCDHQLQRPLANVRFVKPTKQGAVYGSVLFQFKSLAPLEIPSQIERTLKDELVRRGVAEDDLRRMNVVAGRTELSCCGDSDTAKNAVQSLSNTTSSSDDRSERPLVVDTDDVSRLLKGDTRSISLKKILEEHRGRKMISFQTQAELFAWILQTGFSVERRQRLQNLIADFQVVWPDDLCSLIWANLINQTRSLGRPVGAQDMWVAAIAIRHGARLCTANLKDFDYLPQLELLPVTQASTRGKELHIQEYLREHGDNASTWDKLRQSVFVVRSEIHPSLILLNVKQHARTGDPGNRVYGCRGLILDEADDYRIVNYPFNSFFNLGTRQSRPIAKKFDWSSATVYPKLDGTLICLYYYKNEFRVSTRGHPDADSSVLEKDLDGKGMSFATLFWKTWKDLGYVLPPQHEPWIRRTYCFELLTPANRVVVPVNKPRIVLIAVRDLDTLQEQPCGSIAVELRWETVDPEPPVTGPDELRARADKLSPVQGEGYVAVDSSWARLKVKSRRYVLAASLPRPNWGWTDHEASLAAVDDAQVMKLVLAGESDEFAAYFPEWGSRFMEMQTKLNQLVNKLEQLLGDAVHSAGTIKEVHAWLSDRRLPAGLLGVLIKTLKAQRRGDTLVVPDRGRLLEDICKEKPVKVLFWSEELFSDASTPAAVTSSESDAGASSDRVRERVEVTRFWQWRPSIIEQLSISIVACAVLVAFWKGALLQQIILSEHELPAISRLVLPVVGFFVGSNTELLRYKGQRLLAKLLAWKRSQDLPLEMQRLGALYENVYSLKTLARTAILEGFLQRLAYSSLKHTMVLRGSLLTRQIVHPQVREARDLDFVACFPWDENDPVGEVLRRIREVCGINLSPDDGVHFGDSSTISGVVIWEGSDTPGVKVSISSASLYGQHYQEIEIDVGFNDPLDPPPFWLSYKALPMFRAPTAFRILAVRPELLFAWKLHGLFENNTINELGQDIQGKWRMKDLHDLWLLARALTSGGPDGIPVQLKNISRAVEVAFASREQDPRLISRLISRDFGCSTGSQRRWRKYRSEAVCPDELPLQLHTMVDRVVEFTEPLLHEMLRRREGFEMVVQAKSPRADPAFEAPSTPIESLDTTGMISELPGRWNVLRNNTRIEFGDVSYEQVHQLLKGSANSLMFGNRSEQYDLVRIKPRQGVRAGYVTVKQAPSFTMRDCTANLVSRRVPVSALSDTNTSDMTTIDTSREEKLHDSHGSTGVEFYQPETPQNEAERGAFEAGKHFLANRLARRLDVLPPLHRIVHVTSSQRKYLEAKKCMAEWHELFVQGPPSVKPPSPSPSTSLWRGPEAAVRSMARYCFDILQAPCLVDLTFLEVVDPAGGPPVLHSASEIADSHSVTQFLGKNHGRSAILRSFVGYLSSSSGRVQLFEGSLEGHICLSAVDADDELKLPLPEKELMIRDRSTMENDFMETVFVPEGYAQPLVNMSKSGFCVGIRHVPLLELAQSLRGRDYSQLFEVHVTVETPKVEDTMARFEMHCADLSPYGFPFAVKPILIQNESGEVPTQMMTSSYHRGSLADVHLEAFRLSQALVRAGYVVARTKIEALLSSRGVPITDEEAKRLSPENYFEFHIKLRLAGDCPLEPLRGLAERHGARLSRNALSKCVETTAMGQVVESWQRRFVNLRLYQVGRDTALERFQACVSDLEESGYAIEKLIREYSVYDTNVALDRGWIDKH